MTVARKAVLAGRSDFMLGAAGCCLAAGSAAFGIMMSVHGPVASLGKSGSFTVFAQLAPHDRASRPTHKPSEKPAEAPQDLDMTATASIPRTSAPAESEDAIIPSVRLQAASADEATVTIDGRPQVVRVGDSVPGAGEVIAIVTGRKPLVRTSRGLIVADRAE